MHESCNDPNYLMIRTVLSMWGLKYRKKNHSILWELTLLQKLGEEVIHYHKLLYQLINT